MGQREWLRKRHFHQNFIVEGHGEVKDLVHPEFIVGQK
jgi:hypothetical protein